MDLSIFRAKLAAATEHLASAGRQAEGTHPSATAGAVQQLRNAASGVDELIRLCNGEAPRAVRACPVCGKSGMADATTCGYCWTRLTPVPR